MRSVILKQRYKFTLTGLCLKVILFIRLSIFPFQLIFSSLYAKGVMGYLIVNFNEGQKKLVKSISLKFKILRELLGTVLVY